MKIRIKFRKYGAMKFIGHLDMMRFFQKVMRMAQIDICYTEGFSPHQIMSFAAPLGVGITSDGEYVDIEVHTTKPSAEAIADLNAVMAEGLEITGYVRLDDKAKTGMSVVSAADYEVWYKEGYEIPGAFQSYDALSKLAYDFYEKQDEILITKKTKKSEKVMDLKKLVYDFKILPPKDRFLGHPACYLLVSTGSTENLKPELVLEAFYQYIGVVYHPFSVQIHRKDVYDTDAQGRRRTLLEAGKEIV